MNFLTASPYRNGNLIKPSSITYKTSTTFINIYSINRYFIKFKYFYYTFMFTGKLKKYIYSIVAMQIKTIEPTIKR